MSNHFVPSDPSTSKRLLDQHEVVIDAFGGSLLLFPFDLTQEGLQVLESGCADGHWLKALSDKCPNPSANTFVGTDLNPKFFPKEHPAHFQFHTHNMVEPWPEKDHNRYDIVHQRLSLPGAARSMPQAVKNLFDLVKPGGYIQLVEAEQIGPDSGPVFAEFLELVRLVFDTTGAGWKYAGELRKWVEEAGAIDIHEVSVDMAFGAAHKDEVLAEKGATCTAGAIAGLVMHAKMMKLKSRFTEDQLDSMADRLLTELRGTGAHYPLRAVWARKRM